MDDIYCCNKKPEMLKIISMFNILILIVSKIFLLSVKCLNSGYISTSFSQHYLPPRVLGFIFKATFNLIQIVLQISNGTDLRPEAGTIDTKPID